MAVGNDSVVIGNVSHKNIGERCVVIGATDFKNNTILNAPMAVGYDAHAGHNGIAIGAYASAGATGNLVAMLSQLKLQIKDQQILINLIGLISEASKPQPDKSMINILWWKIKGACRITENMIQFISLVEKISQQITLLF